MRYPHRFIVDWEPVNLKLFLSKTMQFKDDDFKIIQRGGKYFVYFATIENLKRFSYVAKPNRI